MIMQKQYFTRYHKLIIIKYFHKENIRNEVIKMKVNAAFIFVAPETDMKEHRAIIETPELRLNVVGVKDYNEGVVVAKELVDKGVKAIELCAGFGNEGISIISKAVKGKASVGAVKFDHHPGFNFKSGDELFL